MKRTLKVFNYKRLFFSREDFDMATVEPFFKVWDSKQKRSRTVWKDVENGCLYIMKYGLLWPY